MIMTCYTVDLCNDVTLRNQKVICGTVNEFLKADDRLLAEKKMHFTLNDPITLNMVNSFALFGQQLYKS